MKYRDKDGWKLTLIIAFLCLLFGTKTAHLFWALLAVCEILEAVLLDIACALEEHNEREGRR